MYLVSENIRRHLLRRYRRRLRDTVKDERLRGWAWEVPPLNPPYDVKLPLSDIAERHCESMRDIYLKHVEGIKKPPTANMIAGRLYHAIVALTFENSKRMIYSIGKTTGSEFSAAMLDLRSNAIEDILEKDRLIETKSSDGSWITYNMKNNLTWCWDYVVGQVSTSLDRVLRMQPHIGVDALVNTAIPIVVEQKLEGGNIGLNGMLSADAYGTEGAVMDVKTGIQKRFHRLTTTGYGLVVESIHEYPVDIGCIIYVWFDSPTPTVEYDIHSIDEPLRQDFIEVRDQAMQLVYEERNPGLPEKCYEGCPYWDYCH